MKKITILALGGAGENFLNSIEKDFKKDISDIEFNLCHLEEKSFNKAVLEKDLAESREIFVVSGVGSNSKLSLILADILSSSYFIILKPFSFEEKSDLFEDLTKN